MTIVAVEPIHLQLPLERQLPATGSGAPAGSLATTLVRLTCGDGRCAWGEGQCASETLDDALALLTPIILDADPLDRGTLWERMVDRLSGLKEPLEGGAAALSALDIALWDAAGQALGLPIWQLLGGRRMARMDAYGTCRSAEPEAAAREAREIIAAGFHSVKVTVGGSSIEQDTAALEAVRAEIGPQVPLLVDAAQSYQSRDEALAFGAVADRVEAFWYEEPLSPGEWADYVALRHALNTPIAGGQHLRSPGALLQAIDRGALDIATPDVRLCGGITGLLKIAELARWSGVQVSPHNCGSQLAAVASTHAAVTLRNCVITELDREDAGLLEDPVRLEDGFIAPPDGPGLGISINEESVTRHSVA